VGAEDGRDWRCILRGRPSVRRVQAVDMKPALRFRIVDAATVVLAGVLLAGCVKPGEVQGKVSGSVSLDGEPMVAGEVAFVRPGRAATVLEVKDGLFDGNVPEGAYRVEIYSYEEVEVIPMKGEPPIKDRRNILPSKYNAESRETVEVASGKRITFEFSVSKKK